MLNSGQKRALEYLESGENVFLTGEAGTGKSFVLNHFLERNKKKNILVCAPTGIAAINVGGSTLHRVFKVPIEPIAPYTYPARTSDVVLKADIIVIDEISMCRFDCFQYIAKAIRKAEAEAQEFENQKSNKPRILPPKQLIVVGDFFQLPPVITDKDRPVLENYWGEELKIGDGFAFQAPLWEKFKFKTVILDEQMRQKGSKNFDFVTNLNKIRCGDVTAVDWFNENASKEVQKGIFICPTNKKVEEINISEASKLSGKSFTYEADVAGRVSISDKPTSDILKLKVGMQVMSIVNDNENRFQNGTIGIIKRLHSETVEVDFNGEIIEIAPHNWEIIDYEISETGDVTKCVIGTFRQLPLKVAYAVTIHKSQGQTYDFANITPSCFAHGQLYVGLSRVKSIENLHLTSKITDKYLVTSEDVLKFYESVVTKSSCGHGGKRDGSGRKHKYGNGVETCTIRIPKSAKEAVLEFLQSKSWE